MSENIIRKQHTGQAGNGGEFGNHSRAEAPTDILRTAEPYKQALTDAKKVGASRATDAGVMALFCESPALQTLCGAVSAELVYNGAQASGMSASELAGLAQRDAGAVAELMWVD